MESPAKLAKDNTMETTAKEGIKILEKSDPDSAAECKAAAQESAKNGSGDAPEITKNGNSPTKLARDTTAQEGKEILENQGGANEEAKTRSQEAELNNSTNGEGDKSATKRPAEEQVEEETDEAKKQKTEEEESKENNGESTEEKAAPAE